MNSSILKKITIVIAVLGFIGGIVLGAKYKTVEGLLLKEKFNTAIMFASWISVVLYSLPMFAIAQSLENQEQIAQTLSKHESKLKTFSTNVSSDNAVSPAKNTKMNLSAVASTSNDKENTWYCKKCGEKNPTSSRTCKSCGQDK